MNFRLDLYNQYDNIGLNHNTRRIKMDGAYAGIGLGSALAITISWSLNHSIWWAILHGIFSWLYVIYYGIWL